MTSQFPALPAAEFSTQEAAVAYIRNHGQEHAYGNALTIKRSYPSLQQVYCCCDRGSYQIRRSKPHSCVPEGHRKQKRTVSQTECQYEVYLRFSKRRGVRPVTESQSHNHER